MIAIWAVFDPRHEDMSPRPAVREDRPPLLPFRPHEPRYDGDLAHRPVRYMVGHLVVERTVHMTIIEQLYEDSQLALP